MEGTYWNGFPLLQLGSRKREFNQYTEEQRASVVYYWLFTRKGFRDIDSICLNLDGQASHGYQSMGIAHYLGLYEAHHGFYLHCPVDQAVNSLGSIRHVDPALALIYCYLRDYLQAELPDSIVKESDPDYRTEKVEATYWIKKTMFADQVPESIDGRLLSMLNVNSKNHTVRIERKRYHYSNGALKETVKCLYDFTCQVCHERIYRPGWVRTLPRIDQWSYLSADAHHIIPLSKEGPDSLNNLLCLCPSCHRKFHTNEFQLLRHNEKIGCEDVILHKQWAIQEKHPITVV